MNIQQQLNSPATPDLPNPQDRYDRLTVAQTNAALRTFFLKAANIFTSLLGPRGGKFINMPYGAFQSSQIQTVAAAATPTLVTINTTDYANGVSRVAGDGFHVEQDGIYNIQFSAQLTNNDTQNHEIDIWLRKGTNGGAATDLAGTASVSTISSTHGGQLGYVIIAANFFVELKSTEFVEFWWAASSTLVQLNALPAITTPFASPAAPSFVATLTFVSNLQA